MSYLINLGKGNLSIYKKLRLIPIGDPVNPDVGYMGRLIVLYTVLKTQQPTTNQFFNELSKKTGDARTVLPINIVINRNGTASFSIADSNLRETLFETDIVDKALNSKQLKIDVTPGEYQAYLLWTEGLNMTLKASRLMLDTTDMECAESPVNINAEELMQISAIDEVYPELNLVTTISKINDTNRNAKSLVK
ncbi:MAG: hypothetical protein LBQ98_03265 [Nitrososphaerota archaeon]|jgi:hypothetical protein|nr:hypothetical protein [Nitrososphaerota archaeon]